MATMTAVQIHSCSLWRCQGLVPKKLCGKSTEAVQLRKEACAACRRHLIWHADVRLHPVQRTAVGTIADATDAEHHAAYLQHDTHGEAIVRLFAILQIEPQY